MIRTDVANVIVYGASRQGAVVLGVLRAQGHRVSCFVDDDPRLAGGRFQGLLVHAGFEWIRRRTPRDFAAIVAIGANNTRVQIGSRLRESGIPMINAVHPSAVVMENVVLGTGVLICAGAVAVAGTRIGDDVVVNTGATVDHDSVLEAGAYLSPGVHSAGGVTVGRGAFVGAGAVIGPGVVIGEGSIVGAGSLVLEDVPARTVAYGHPARPVRPVPDPPDWRRILAGQKGNEGI